MMETLLQVRSSWTIFSISSMKTLSTIWSQSSLGSWKAKSWQQLEGWLEEGLEKLDDGLQELEDELVKREDETAVVVKGLKNLGE